jgi:hypothetical protein
MPFSSQRPSSYCGALWQGRCDFADKNYGNETHRRLAKFKQEKGAAEKTGKFSTHNFMETKFAWLVIFVIR